MLISTASQEHDEHDRLNSRQIDRASAENQQQRIEGDHWRVVPFVRPFAIAG